MWEHKKREKLVDLSAKEQGYQEMMHNGYGNFYLEQIQIQKSELSAF